MRQNIKGNIILLMAAMVWGLSLVAQKEGLKYIEPMMFTAIRCLLGGIVMMPFAIVQLRKNFGRRAREDGETGEKRTRIDPRDIVKCGLICGTLIGVTILLQQTGLPYTSVGKAGFITALYIFLTPIMGLFMGKKTTRNLWIGVAVGLGGLYLLCLFSGIEAVTFGDFMMFCAAFLCAAHIHAIDHFAHKLDTTLITFSQFVVGGVICLIPALIFTDTSWAALKAAILPILYSGVIASAVGYSLQTIGQRMTNPNLASLIMAMETVFTLISGWIFFGEVLAVHEYIGCALMFAAIVISQLPDDVFSVKKLRRSEENVDIHRK